MSKQAMTPAKLEAMGHVRMSPLKAIRARCLDCCVGSAHEVALCAAVKCPSWPFRLGTNPWVAEAMKRPNAIQPQPCAKPPASALPKSQGETFNNDGKLS